MEQVSIVRTETTPVGEVVRHPDNARRGDLQRIEKSLRDHGQYRPIVVHEPTGYILAGNHTHQAAEKLGWSHIDVTFVQCSEEKARAVLAIDNRAADSGGYDDEALLALLEALDADDLLGEAAFERADIDDLIAKLEEGFPEPEPYDADPKERQSLADKAAGYNDQPTRMIVLNFPLAQFTWMVDTLAELGEQYGLDSNAEVVLRLAEDAMNVKAPGA